MIKNAHLCPRRAPTATTTVEYTQFRVSCLSPAHSPLAAVGVRVPCSLLAVLRTSGEVPVGLFSINTTFAKNEARPRPGQTRPLPGTRAQGDSVIHKLHRYEVHTRMSDHPRQGRTTTYDEPRTGQCNLQRTCARNDAAGG